MRKGSLGPETIQFKEAISTDFLQPKGSKNLHGFTLYTYRSMFLLKAAKETGINKQLWIDRNTGRPTELDDTEDAPTGFSMVKECSAFLGIINVMDCMFLLTVDDVVQICSIQGHKIYTIASVSFISMEVEKIVTEEKKKIVLNYLTNIRKLLSFGYYFSLTYDLTLSKQKNFNKCPTDRQFQWNYALYQELNKFNIDPVWQVPLIQGFVGHFTTSIDDKSLEYFLISRRSCMNSGTRYYARGLDDNANVANYVETEQIVIHQSVCISQLQVRGSVPVFWKQKGLQAIIKLERNYELTNHVFLNHMKSLNDNYGFVICLNLMSKSKRDEQMISDAFENHLKTNVLENVGYEYFDFHGVVQGQKYDKTNVVFYKVQPALDSFGFHFEDAATGIAIQQQKGIIRTNCQDCLDRTNYIQSKIAMTALDLMLEKIGVKLRQVFAKEAFEELDNTESKQYSLVVGFKNIWGDNGDALSIHYTGAGSAIAEVTRVGKGSLFGIFDRGVKGVSRFYNGSFEDKLKQECLDYLLGKHSTNSNVINEAYELEIQSREKEFSTFNPLNVFVVTWNVAGSPPDTNLDLRNLFDYRNRAAPDLILVGLQEVVELNPTTVMSNNHQKPSVQLWKDCILNTIRKQDKYIAVSEVDLVGLLLLMFAKEDCSKRIVKVQADKVKTGLKGTLGNKGGVVVKLSVDDTTFSFVNCHLVPSASGLQDRIGNLKDIHKKAFQQEEMGVRKADRIMHSDVKFLFGDTNFRLSTGNNAKPMIADYKFLKTKGEEKKAQEIFQALLKFDQLHQIREGDKILKHYKEGQITFLPTYKYDPFSEEYDTSKKQRTPAWTDRILWSSNTTAIEQHFYDRVEYLMSDHRPVISYFTVQVKKVDKAKKEEITKKVYEVVEFINKREESMKKMGVSEIKSSEFFEDVRPKSKSFVTHVNRK